MAEEKTPWTAEQHAAWLINSINSYRAKTERDPLSKEFEDEILASMQARIGNQTPDAREEQK